MVFRVFVLYGLYECHYWLNGSGKRWIKPKISLKVVLQGTVNVFKN